jgi:hypothetical protein
MAASKAVTRSHLEKTRRRRRKRLAQFRDGWELFHRATARNCLYVLGAGASAPTIPINVSERIMSAVAKQGIYDGVSHLPSPLTRALAPWDPSHELAAMLSGRISVNELIAHTPNPVIEAIASRMMTTTTTVRPPQYAVFDHFASSIIFNFNTDDLDRWIDSRHEVIQAHGSIEADFVHSDAVTQGIRHLAVPDEFEDWLTHHRPLPEPSTMTSRPSYRALVAQFGAACIDVIIGYSFGEQPQSGIIHDSESFELLVELMRRTPRPTLVIGPYPERVAERIAAAIHRPVTILPCRWNVLAEFILSGKYRLAWQESLRKGTRALRSAYRRIEEASLK